MTLWEFKDQPDSLNYGGVEVITNIIKINIDIYEFGLKSRKLMQLSCIISFFCIVLCVQISLKLEIESGQWARQGNVSNWVKSFWGNKSREFWLLWKF